MIIACVYKDGSFDLPHRHRKRKTNELSTRQWRERKKDFFFHRQTDQKKEREEKEKTANETQRRGMSSSSSSSSSLTQHTCFLLSLSANTTIVVVGDISLGSRAQHTHTHISSSVYSHTPIVIFDEREVVVDL